MRLRALLADLSELVAFPHTVFALPFALMATLAAARGWPGARTLFWVVVAMVGARTAAMAFNRLADLQFDAANPRTSSRPLPSGRLRRGHAWGLVIVGASALVLAAGQLNKLCLALSPLALGWVLAYSFTKRFTAFCHFWLGLALAIAPVAGWLAVTGWFALPPVILGAAVAFWVAGFDVLYSLQDFAFDRQMGLYSLPARLGVGRALWVARLSHLLAAWGFAGFAKLVGVGLWGTLGVGMAWAMLLFQHLLVAGGRLDRINAAFFTTNGFLSLSMLVLFAIDMMVGP